MFFLFPVSVDHRANVRPLVTLWLLGLCVGLYGVSLLVWISGGEAQLEHWYEALAFIPAQARLHTWITNIFVHAGVFHLIGNMVYLYLFGACVEDLLGHWRFTVFYLAAGIVATLAHVILSGKGFASEVPLVGASGAISACMGACALLLRGMKIEFRFVYFFIFAAGAKTFFVPSWLMMSLWFADDLLGLLLSLNTEGGGIAFGAHVGGFLFGLAVAYAVRRKVERGDFSPEPVAEPAPSALPAPVFVHFDGIQHGPFPVHDVWHQVRNGTIPAEALYWREDLQQWRPVNEL
ncbi:MAG TPA: rhomboid family intramembrane serine protease [Verrucomicrobiota bacterium]|nr:hypothetical protein [Verrucomicrobiales bacterium]HRI12100.1 rhomboid family intramembrane serine protease [Verrucomicrobiota bacterium]